MASNRLQNQRLTASAPRPDLPSQRDRHHGSPCRRKPARARGRGRELKLNINSIPLDIWPHFVAVFESCGSFVIEAITEAQANRTQQSSAHTRGALTTRCVMAHEVNGPNEASLAHKHMRRRTLALTQPRHTGLKCHTRMCSMSRESAGSDRRPGQQHRARRGCILPVAICKWHVLLVVVLAFPFV